MKAPTDATQVIGYRRALEGVRKDPIVVLAAYSAYRRLRNKAFTLSVRSAFDSFGTHSSLSIPVRLHGTKGISIGNNVHVGEGSWLQTIPGTSGRPSLLIGDNTSLTGYCVLSAAVSITIGRSVLMARNVYISDHIHAYSDPDLPIMSQGIERLEPVTIEDGAWLGQNVVVVPGVTIGYGSVIGANSVVTANIPPRSLAVGAPAVVRRTLPGISM